MDRNELACLEALSELYPTAEEAAAEIALLEGALALPRGTELFASDIHGEYNAFSHLLRSGSGAVRALVEATFDDSFLPDERAEIAASALYPVEKVEMLLAAGDDESLVVLLECLADLARAAAATQLTVKVDALVPEDFTVVVEELLAANTPLKRPCARAIIEGAVAAGAGAALAEVLGQLVQHLVVDQLHLVGDVYDRGPAPAAIMDELLDYPTVDVQWGNHDILWMGAALGQPGSVANVVRICARYGNLSILEDSYGINLRPLAAFAAEAYADDPCAGFALKGNPGLTPTETALTEKIQKAMAIIQFKVEAALIAENPSFGLDDRNLLHLVNRERGTVVVDGVEYELTDTVFPTVDWSDPYRLTEDETSVIEHLCAAFANCERLGRHMDFFLEHGSLYKIENGNLMLHACVPLAADGSLLEVTLFGETYRGRALYDMVDASVRAAFTAADEAERKRGLDMLWYLWLGPGSPLFAKSKMATFELYLIADKAARKEVKNPFYSLLDDPAVIDGIFRDFGMDPATSRIVCGHVPVKAKDGEDPVKAEGRVLCIDGGFSAAYQKTTGLAGYTLVSNAEGLFLDANEPLASREAAVEQNVDVAAERRVIERYDAPRTVADTDEGAVLRQRIGNLHRLLGAYAAGLIAEEA
ncbi:fructose-bisphosphatase class III [Adlercreutzia sp. R7]|uniref:Fructose-bisphosphatase class III n=1 Tax=Adlercreutzia wanghongyangiae TaxID=3111451 RepID=A0ABU6IID4_9ACTN|nr:fructose-bisphosphatase class III [Adlercreutzia sp. R7]